MIYLDEEEQHRDRDLNAWLFNLRGRFNRDLAGVLDVSAGLSAIMGRDDLEGRDEI